MNCSLLARLASRAAAIFCLALSARATDYTWTGKAPSPNNGNWSSPQNWSPSTGVPGGGDTATIGADENGGGFTVALDQAAIVAGLTINGSTLGGGGSLTVNGNFVVRASTLSSGGGITVNNGTMSFLPLDQSPAVESDLGCPLTLNAGAQATVAANTLLKYIAAVPIQNNGTFTLGNGATLGFGTVGGQFINAGAFAAGASFVNSGGPGALFTNAPAGVVQVSSGILSLAGPSWSGTGAFSAGSNGVIQINLASGFTAAFHDGAVFSGPGTTILLGGSQNNNTTDGAVIVAGNLQLGGPGGGAGLVNLGTLTVASNAQFTWFGGFIAGNDSNIVGTIAVAEGGLMTMNGLSPLDLYSTVLTNNGTINWTNNSDLTMGYNARIDNSFLFHIEHDSAAIMPLSSGGPGYNGASVQNYYQFDRGVTATAQGVTLIAVPFYNYPPGRAAVLGGTLSLDAGGLPGNCDGNSGPTASFRFRNGAFSAVGAVLYYGTFLMDESATFDLGVGGTMVVREAIFQQNSGLIKGSGQMQIVGLSTNIWSGGSIAVTNLSPATPALLVDSNSVINIVGNGLSGAHSISGGRLANYGVINLTTNADGFDDYVYVGDGEVIDNFGTFNFQTDQGLSDASSVTRPVLTNEAGSFVAKVAAKGTSRIGFLLKNLGQVLAQSGILELAAYDDAGTQTPAYLRMQDGTVKFDQSTGLNGVIQGNGQIVVNGVLTNQGVVEGDILTIVGDSANEGDLIAGDAPGIFTAYNFSQSPPGRLIIPIQGTNAATPDFGQVIAQGAATLGGTLVVNLTNGYAPPIGASFPFLSSHLGRSGTFSTVTLPPGLALNYTSSGATLVVTGAVPAQIQAPQISAGQFQFGFNTVNGGAYTIQYSDDLSPPNWMIYTNFTGNGSFWRVTVPPPPAPRRFFRVSEP